MSLIPPEITGDGFAALLTRLAAEATGPILDVGASGGEGSTAALVAGAERNPRQPRVFALEPLRERFEALAGRYRNHGQVTCLHAASVPQALTEAQVRAALAAEPCWYDAETACGWLRDEQAALAREACRRHGIARARQLAGEAFALAVLDGSEFCGPWDLDSVFGAAVIALDDTGALKNRENYTRLKGHPEYRLLAEDRHCRGGWAVFVKRKARRRHLRVTMTDGPVRALAPSLRASEQSTR